MNNLMLFIKKLANPDLERSKWGELYYPTFGAAFEAAIEGRSGQHFDPRDDPRIPIRHTFRPGPRWPRS